MTREPRQKRRRTSTKRALVVGYIVFTLITSAGYFVAAATAPREPNEQTGQTFEIAARAWGGFPHSRYSGGSGPMVPVYVDRPTYILACVAAANWLALVLFGALWFFFKAS
jgi:hypothetical protein